GQTPRAEDHTMRIAGVASAFPKNYYPQSLIRKALKENWGGKMERPELVDRLHNLIGVNGRHLALPLERYKDLRTWGQANDAWIESAQELGKLALCRALTQAGVGANELGAIFFVTVTGVASPSIEGRMINRMGLSRNLKRIPIFGLGCVAGAAGIARAADYVRGYHDQLAALVAVELCSLTWQKEDLSTSNLIATGLFGDGAAAVIVGGNERIGHGPRILATKSIFYPD